MITRRQLLILTEDLVNFHQTTTSLNISGSGELNHGGGKWRGSILLWACEDDSQGIYLDKSDKSMK